jgi:hypothetical protein
MILYIVTAMALTGLPHEAGETVGPQVARETEVGQRERERVCVCVCVRARARVCAC